MVGGLREAAFTDPLGHVNRQRSDRAGRIRRAIDAEGNATVRVFDATGSLVSERDPNGVGRDCTYDALRQQTGCTDTQGDTRRFEYDAAGNQVAITDGEGVRSSCSFDFLDRKQRCTDGIGGTTRFAYDASSNLVRITDAEGNTTSYTYDPRNLRLTETYPDASGPTDRVTRTYDAAGRLATRTDQGGDTTTYGYDAASRLREKRDAAGKIDSFVYDPVGRFLGGTSQRYGTTVTSTYDGAGLLASEALSVPAAGGAFTVGYGYDAADRLTSVRYPDGSVVSRAYTSRDQVAEIPARVPAHRPQRL